MKKFYILIAVLFTAILSSCSKSEESFPAVYQTYWEGSTTVTQTSGTSVTQVTYTLQIYFKTESKSICQYTLGFLRDSYTTDYKMTNNTVVCTVKSYYGDYEETGTISSDGNTMTYHTKIFTDDENSWTDITMTKKPVPTE